MTMGVIATILFLLFLIVFIIPFLPLRIRLSYTYENGDDQLQIDVYVAFVKVYTYAASLIDSDKESMTLSRKKKRKRAGIGLTPLVLDFLKKVYIRHFTWHTAIGVSDAAHTAQLVGMIWALKGSVLGLVFRFMNLKCRPNVSVQPNFQQPLFRLFFSCMITFRIGHAIIAGLKVWKRRKRQWNIETIHEQQTM